jgi:hypothetical protein
MTAMLTINAVRIEQTEVTVPAENFEAGYQGDFERVLERSRQNREAMETDLARNRQELREARKELEEGLRTKREDLEAELKKRSQRVQEYQRELESAVQGEDGQEEAAAESFAADRVSKRTALASLVVAGSSLPTGFKRQIGASLMASGRTDNAVNGYLLTGGGRPTAFLKDTLEKLGALGQSWKLDKEALPELESLFIESRTPAEEAAGLIAALSEGPLTLDNVLRTVSKADDLAAQTATDDSGGQSGAEGLKLLTATPGGLNNLGQFLASLGLSTEVVKAATSFTPGQSFSSQDLREILSQNGSDAILAPLLADSDLVSLVEALKAMGADQNSLGQLSTFLAVNQGQATLDDLLGLLAFTEQPGPLTPDPRKVADQIQNLLSQTRNESELVKAPLFNEIVMKMALLGDRQVSDDFADLSPALQALRGGISVWRQESDGDFERGGGRRDQGRERQERLLAQGGLKAQSLGWGLEQPQFEAPAAAETAGYAGETLARQIGQKLVYSARRGVHRLRMNLDPESLGRLDVELKVKGDKLTAFIKAESLEAYEALEKEMSSLKDNLAQAGLDLEMTLSYDGGAGQGQAMARAGRDLRQAGGRPVEEPGDGPNIDIISGRASGDRLLDAIV